MAKTQMGNHALVCTSHLFPQEIEGEKKSRHSETFFFFLILLSKSTHHQPFGYRGPQMLIGFGPTLGKCRTVVSNSKHISSGERGSPLAAALKYDSAGRLTVRGEPRSPYLLSMPSPCRVDGPYSSMESELVRTRGSNHTMQ